MLILLGGALLGVLVEAFVSRAKRPIVQLTLALGVLSLALLQVWNIRGEQSLTPAMGSIIIDGPAVLLQGSILIISIIAILLIADTEHFTALPAALPGSEEERKAIAMGAQVTEVYPLTLFAVAGMYAMPIFYLPGWVPEIFKPLLYINPFSYLVWCYQDIFYFGSIVHPEAWGINLIGSLFIFIVGYRFFRKVKPGFGSAL
jgi:hypothetical protein